MNINRSSSRGIALQILFELDMQENLHISEDDLILIIERHLLDFLNIKEEKITESFVFYLLKSVQEKMVTLDELIMRAAPEWSLEKINIVDRNILRLGLLELVFGEADQVPPKVAINEAIELAKNYGGETSYKFVNGVLGAVYKEMGEPGKDQGSKEIKKNNINGQRQTSTKVENQELAGCLVYSRYNNQTYLAFIKDIFKYWTLPKGKLMIGEDVRVGAIRKVKEEIGINVVVKDNLKENSYISNNDENISGRKIKKHVIYLLAEGKHEALKPEVEKSGILEAKWFALDEIENLKMYNDIKPILKLGLEKIIV